MPYFLDGVPYTRANSPYAGANGNSRNRIRRAVLFALIGGEKCRWCGSTDRVQFDHIDRSQKLFDIESIVLNATHTNYDVTEVLKCQPLCKFCHLMKTKLERWPRPRPRPRSGAEQYAARKARLQMRKAA